MTSNEQNAKPARRPISITTKDRDGLLVTQEVTAVELSPGWLTFTTKHGTWSLPSFDVVAVQWTDDEASGTS